MAVAASSSNRSLTTIVRASAAAPGPLGHGIGDVLGTLAGPGDEDAFRHGGKRGQLRVPLHEKSVLVGAEVEKTGHLLGVRPRFHGRGEDHHIDGDLDETAHEGIVHFHDELSREVGIVRFVRDPGRLAPDEFHILFDEPVIELLVALARRPHVDIELVDVPVGFFLQEMGEFQGIHAAHPAAVFIVVLVAAPDAMEDRDALRLLAVPHDHLAARRDRRN